LAVSGRARVFKYPETKKPDISPSYGDKRNIGLHAVYRADFISAGYMALTIYVYPGASCPGNQREYKKPGFLQETGLF
jgi:hypothetical protein